MIPLLVAACGVEVEPRGPCPGPPHGTFELLEATGITTFDGRIWEGPAPGVRRMVEVFGACRTMELPRCDGGCAPGEHCGIDGCGPFPAAVDRGPLRVWSGAERFVVEPLEPGALYSASIPMPEPGRTVRVRGEGLELAVPAVAPLVGAPARLPVAAGEPLPLQWEPAGASTIVFRLALDQHGATQAELECRFPDTGRAEIPADAVDALYGIGLSGFPRASLARIEEDHQDGAGACVELRARSLVPIAVEFR